MYCCLPRAIVGGREKADWEFRVCSQGEVKGRTCLLMFCHLLPMKRSLLLWCLPCNVWMGELETPAVLWQLGIPWVLHKNLSKFSCFCQILVVGGNSFPAWMPVRELLFLLEWMKSIVPLICLSIHVYRAPVRCWRNSSFSWSLWSEYAEHDWWQRPSV